MTSRASSVDGGAPIGDVDRVADQFGDLELRVQEYLDSTTEMSKETTKTKDTEEPLITHPTTASAQATSATIDYAETKESTDGTEQPTLTSDDIAANMDDSESPYHTFKRARILSRSSEEHSSTGLGEFGRVPGAVQDNRTAMYKGEVTKFDIDNINVAETDNHAIHIIGIPAAATFADIFSIITGGEVFHFNRLAPVPGVRPLAAGNLTLMTRAAAEALMGRIKAPRGVAILGERISAVWNRHRVGSVALARYQRMTRVVCMKGPRKDFELQALLEFLAGNFKFDLVKSSEERAENGKKQVVLEFTSIRAQAQNAVLLMTEMIRDYARRPELFEVSYGKDPCAVTRWTSGPWRRSA